MRPAEIELVLASASPRRREILRRAGYNFKVQASGIDEGEIDPSDPAGLATALALKKAEAVAEFHPDKPVVGADTLVVLDRQVLGKPRDRDRAVEMLRLLSGKTHQVYTGLALVWTDRGITIAVCEKTDVTFRELDDRDIIDYVASGEPMDKAGSYGIQELGSVLVERIEGCYFNVMGLPVARLTSILKNLTNDGGPEGSHGAV